jgi:hypothetical protein
MGLDTKTDWLTDWLTVRQSQCEFDFDFDNGLLVGKLAAGKNVSKEAADIVGIRQQATTREDTADWEGFMRAAAKCRVCVN